jgi:hypothetical protein
VEVGAVVLADVAVVVVAAAVAAAPFSPGVPRRISWRISSRSWRIS